MAISIISEWNGKPYEHCTRKELLECVRVMSSASHKLNEMQRQHRNDEYEKEIKIIMQRLTDKDQLIEKLLDRLQRGAHEN